MLCGTGLPLAGDAAYLGGPLSGSPAASPRPGDEMGRRQIPAALSYFAGTDPADPLVWPGESPEALKCFPASLLVTASRDFAASSTSVMHRRLCAAGADARLFVFDGLWHAFHVFPELPESREVYQLLANFFDRTLAR